MSTGPGNPTPGRQRRKIPMTPPRNDRPSFTPRDAVRLARDRFGLRARARELPSYRDRNFLLRDGEGRRRVLKVVRREDGPVLDLEDAALEHLAARDFPFRLPRVEPAPGGARRLETEDREGRPCLVRLAAFVEGRPLARVPRRPPGLLRSAGALLGALDRALEGFSHPAAERPFPWDPARLPALRPLLAAVPDAERRRRAERVLDRFEAEALPRLAELPAAVIHNDGNDHNLLVTGRGPSGLRVTGIVDFGDMVRTAAACEAAVAAAYLMLGEGDPLRAAFQVVSGYHEQRPLSPEEAALLFPLVEARLVMSVLHSAEARREDPDNAYLAVSEAPAWEMLERLEDLPSSFAEAVFRRACGLDRARPSPPLRAWLELDAPPPAGAGAGPRARGEALPGPGPGRSALLAARRRRLGPSLGLAYDPPLVIVRGKGCYLFDAAGRPYLDLVNNVCHVGHCHPEVVRALARQAALLNTNTRYLHPGRVRYAERLAACFPPPLEVIHFTNSGSEANELALRMARACTGGTDVVVLEGAYHGHTGGLIDVSPYKFDGPGGSGPPPHVHKVPMPDPYRGPFRYGDPGAGARYADFVREALEAIRAAGRRPAAFLCEPLMGCGGQIVPPPGFLAEAFRHARAAGALCIADEVQVGFGRTGTGFWAFESQGVLPDIVTLGKPMGNGHPIGGVVTRRDVADAFDTGMEYFNTYGGNPVSCAVGLAVLEVIEEEGLRERARRLGARFRAGLEALAERHPVIGDVRGLGLFIGVELVEDRETRAPAAARAAHVVARAREEGILLSTDGPLHNVLKIKPPLVLAPKEVDLSLEVLDRILAEDFHVVE